jgi:hypothetical protein
VRSSINASIEYQRTSRRPSGSARVPRMLTSVGFYFYNGRHDMRCNGRILCARVAPALVIRNVVSLLAHSEMALHKCHVRVLQKNPIHKSQKSSIDVI